MFVTAPFIRFFSNRAFSLEKELKSYGKRPQTPLLWDFSVCLYYTIRAFLRVRSNQRGRGRGGSFGCVRSLGHKHDHFHILPRLSTGTGKSGWRYRVGSQLFVEEKGGVIHKQRTTFPDNGQTMVRTPFGGKRKSRKRLYRAISEIRSVVRVTGLENLGAFFLTFYNLVKIAQQSRISRSFDKRFFVSFGNFSY